MKKGSYTDITGNRYGRLTVIEYAYTENRRPYFKCRCDCGNEKLIQAASLKSGHTKSCGCYVKEFLKTGSITHGDTRKRLYNVWISMKERCCNKTNAAYANYGGRGITICDEWLYDYAVFKDWALNNGYDEKLTLDRIDVNGNYEPSNCRWATKREQAINRRNTLYINYKGETKPLSVWCEDLSLSYEAVRRRIRDKHWSADRAFETPFRAW